MKKVFHIVSNNWTSGLEKVVMNICQMVPGFDFVYVVPSGEIIEDLKKRNIKYLEVNKVTPLSIKKIIKGNDIDVIHGHDVKASLCIAANYRLCKKNSIKMVSELHNDDERMHKISIRSLLYAASSFFYDNVVLVSEKILNDYKFKKFIDKKSIVIDNVINPDVLIQTEPLLKDKNDLDFLFVGRLEYQKNPELFVEFINRIRKENPHVKSYMIGKGSLKDKLEQKIGEYNLSDNIKLLGYQSNPYNYIKNAKAVVITSRYEGLCMVALESLLIGTPVITTDVTGVKQLINQECGLKSNNLDDLVDFGNKIINSQNLREKLHKGAKNRSRVVNNIQLFIDKYTNLYN